MYPDMRITFSDCGPTTRPSAEAEIRTDYTRYGLSRRGTPRPREEVPAIRAPSTFFGGGKNEQGPTGNAGIPGSLGNPSLSAILARALPVVSNQHLPSLALQ